jgi:tetratricopeptide (TPR) repeat protein
MKKYLFILLILTPVFAFCSAADGDAAYARGNFADALDRYETALKTGPSNPYLYYNIGNCYFKTGSLGRSLAYYAKAFYLAPGNGDIRHNLEFAVLQTGQTLVPKGLPVILHKAFFVLSERELDGAVLCVVWLLCPAFVFYIFKKRGNKLVIAFAALLVLFGLWRGAYFYVLRGLDGVTVNPAVDLRSGPGDNFELTAVLPEGSFVSESDVKDDWVLVYGSNGGVNGWTKKQNIINLKDI